jgi:hypothetical protein
MSDDIDLAQGREALDRDLAIKAASRPIPPGVPGVCGKCGEHSPRLIGGKCGEHSPRLIGGACAPCRDKWRLP